MERKDETTLLPHSVYPFVVERKYPGWPGSGFVRKNTEVRVRRVSLNGVEEAQVEITIREFKGKGERMYTYSGSLVLDPAQIDQLVEALKNVKICR